uniref:Structural ORFs n=1 Tax=Ambidensovirus sp. TaxID=2050976 RepID=A0A2Z4EVF4_9VIRU|nr:Structural ORFs [Ambidensovirus sp.]
MGGNRVCGVSRVCCCHAPHYVYNLCTVKYFYLRYYCFGHYKKRMVRSFISEDVNMSEEANTTVRTCTPEWSSVPEGFGRIFGDAPVSEEFEVFGVTQGGDPDYSSRRRDMETDEERSYAVDNDLGRTTCIRCFLEGRLDQVLKGQRLCHQIYYPTGRLPYPHGRNSVLGITKGHTWQGATHHDRRNSVVSLHIEKDGDWDKSHLHVVHSCDSYYRRSTCTCRGYVDFRPAGLAFKRSYAAAGADRGRSLLLYLSKDGRNIQEVNFADGAASWNQSYGPFPVHDGCDRTNEDTSRYEETYTYGFPRVCNVGCGADVNSRGVRSQLFTGEGSDSPNKRGQWNIAMGEKAAAAVLKWFPEDQTSLALIPEFKTEFPQLYWDQQKRKQVLDVAFEDATKAWLFAPLEEIIAKRWANPLSFLRNNHKPYYSPQISADILMRLVLEQNDSNIERAIEFISNVITVVDKKLPKQNTIVIIGEPSSGKTYFIHSLLTLLWKYGQIRNNKKNGDSFTYQDALGCRAVEWNECLLMGKEEIETAKMVWEGAPTPINVKYKSNQRMQRTPLFVTSNGSPWRMCQQEARAFQQRAFVHYWKSASWLKFFGLYPNPLAWKTIYETYEDHDAWNRVPSITELHLQVSPPVNPDIFFDSWVKENVADEERHDIIANCILYHRDTD